MHLATCQIPFGEAVGINEYLKLFFQHTNPSLIVHLVCSSHFSLLGLNGYLPRPMKNSSCSYTLAHEFLSTFLMNKMEESGGD